MVDKDQAPHAGDALFEAFVEQVKQVLEHLYDFAYLQQHPLARVYDRESDLSAKTAGRQLRYDVIKVIESLKPQNDAHFRAPIARLYNILHLYYVENLSIQEASLELGLSERQAYRDLKRGQESVAAALWHQRLPQTAHPPSIPLEASLESELTQLKLTFATVDLWPLLQNAQAAVGRLAQQRGVDIVLIDAPAPMMLSTDAGVAQQILVSLLSSAAQQAAPGELVVSLRAEHRSTITLSLRHTRYPDDNRSQVDPVTRALAQRLRWKLASEDAEDTRQITLEMASGKATLFVIDDNEGWIELLGRFLEGTDSLVIAASHQQDSVQQAHDLMPTLIILDVMMPGRDGWELLQRLRANPSTMDIPIMVCTVFHDSQLAYSLGASAFVSKPAGREQILEALAGLGVL